MTTFLIDIWHDLREKRLWPVAVALLVATVAVPVVLFKPASEAPQAPPPVTGDNAALPTVALDQSSVDNSGLGTFDPADPFKGHADSEKSGLDQSGGSTPASGPGGGKVSLTDSLFGGDAGSGGTAGGSGGTAPGGSGGGGRRYFTYVVDVHFGARDKAKSYQRVETLDLLPNDQNPVVSFMGMVENAKTAVFFVVDPAIQADGEGACNPSPEACRFVYLKVDDDQDEEILSGPSGSPEYTLKLDAIHIKDLSGSEVSGDTTPDKGDTTPDVPSSAKRTSKRRYNLATAPKLTFGGSR